MYTISAIILARPSSVRLGPIVAVQDCELQTLCLPTGKSFSPFSTSFEQASTKLNRLPRLFLEPDGSFVWVSDSPENQWQLDGVLFDRADRLSHVQVEGTCPEIQFDQFLSAIGWPETDLLFELKQHGTIIDEGEFRRHLSA